MRVLWFVVGAVIIALVLGILFGQRTMIYFPNRANPGAAGAILYGGEEVVLDTEDQLELQAWLFRPGSNDTKAAVLYAPGNGGNREGRAEAAVAIAALGYTVLILEYRGYGGNPGSPTEDGLAMDARAGARYLRERGFSGDRTLYVGESLGTGVVTQLATTDPPAGILLRSPYTSLSDVAQDTIRWLPIRLLLLDRYETMRRLPELEMPISVLAGDADQVVAPKQSAEVAANAKHLHKHVVLQGVGHNDTVWFGSYLADEVADLAHASILGL